ncbi:MAG: nucleoside-diphosphate kinase [Candidatus Muiribacteriota bacterium]
MAEKTLVILKPDAVFRGLSGNLISRFENAGFKICAAKFIKVSFEMAERHYEEHKGRDYYNRLMNFIQSGPVFALVLEGPDVILKIRKMTGATVSVDRVPGTIRGDYSINNLFNLIHSSDSAENAEREINIFFTQNEIIDYETASDRYWFFEE